jgi:predicted phage baseplate assembly protein
VALQPPNLDDRSFQSIVDEAKQLIPRYCPEWTNHNLSDPGIALIELFAWMSEMIIFRLNQVPDRLYTKFLELVGIEPFGPSVARTELTFWLSTVLDTPVVVPAGTEVATAAALSGTDQVLFSTVDDLVIAPPELIAAKTAQAERAELFTDVWDELRYESGRVVCFTSDPLAAGDALYLGFEKTLAGNAVRLRVAASIEGIGVYPADPPLQWETWSGQAWISIPVESDTTGGLNQNGNIILMMPTSQQPLSLSGTRAYWLRARLVEPRPGQPTYQASPKLRSLRADSLGGTAQGEHATRLGPERVGRSDGSPDQSFAVSRPPVLARRAEERVQVVTSEGGVNWEEVDDFTESGPGSHHYVWDDATGVITFGPSVRYADGHIRQHGAIPPIGADVVVTSYRHGGGASGNVPAESLTVLRTSLAFIDRVVNRAAADGGVDAESMKDAKLRGPLTLRTGQRAVTARDFERLTLEASPEVARVRCLPPHPLFGTVRLLVVPDVRTSVDVQQLDDFALPDILVERIRHHLDERRTIGTVLEVRTPYYQGVSVAALVRALPGRPANLVRQRALDILYRYINPLVGWSDSNGWPFDTDLNAAPLAQLLEGIEGVERVHDVLLFEYDLRTRARHGLGREVIQLDRQSLFLSAAHQVVVR